MIDKGTEVRLVGNVWLPEWKGLIGVVITDRASSRGSFVVQVYQPPADAQFGGTVLVHQDDQVEVLD